MLDMPVITKDFRSVCLLYRALGCPTDFGAGEYNTM